MKNQPRKYWLLVGVTLCLVAGGAIFLGQAITFSWISSFPEQAPRLNYLSVRFWVSLAMAVLCVVLIVPVCLLAGKSRRK